MKISRNVAYMMAISVPLLSGCIGIFSRTLFDAGMSPLEVSFSRTLVTCVTFLLIALVIDRTLFKINRSDLWLFVLFGLMKFSTDTFMFMAQSSISLSSASILQMSAPYYVVFFAYLLFGERITSMKIAAIVIGFVGCIMVTGAFSDFESSHVMGLAYATMSGFTLAIYTIGCKLCVNRGYRTETMLMYFFLIGLVVSGLMVDPTHAIGVALSDYTVWGSALILGVFMTALAYNLHTRSMTVLEAGTVSVILMFECVVASIVGEIFFNEILTPLNIVGMVLVFASVIMISRNENKEEALAKEHAHEQEALQVTDSSKLEESD